jgi:hypothetical protein
MIRRRAAVAIAAIALGASAAEVADPPACEGTLSGSVTGRFACVAAVIPGEAGQRFLVITPKDRVEGVPTYQPGSFELTGPVAAGTWTLDTLGAGMASVAAEGGTLYTATKTSSQRGEVTVTLRSATPDAARPGGFVVHGSYRARLLPAGGGKQGEVVVAVRF